MIPIFQNPFLSVEISANKMVTGATDTPQKLIGNNPGGDFQYAHHGADFGADYGGDK